MSGQSITDRITAAQHSVTGSAVSKTVCKATTHEVMGPKKKHLDCEYPYLKGYFPDSGAYNGGRITELWRWRSYKASKPLDDSSGSANMLMGDYIV